MITFLLYTSLGDGVYTKILDGLINPYVFEIKMVGLLANIPEFIKQLQLMAKKTYIVT